MASKMIFPPSFLDLVPRAAQKAEGNKDAIDEATV